MGDCSSSKVFSVSTRGSVDKGSEWADKMGLVLRDKLKGISEVGGGVNRRTLVQGVRKMKEHRAGNNDVWMRAFREVKKGGTLQKRKKRT